MKKNLAKRIVLGLLTGAVLMSSSVVWAANVDIGNGTYSVYTFSDGSNTIGTSFGVGYSGNTGSGINPGNITSNATNSIVIGINSHVQSVNSVALGNNATVNDTAKNSVALGYGSIASDPKVVSVGNGGTTGGVGADYRKIVNVDDGIIGAGSHEAVTGGQLYTTITDIKKKIGGDDFSNLAQDSNVNSLFTNDKIVNNATTLVSAIKTLDNQVYLNRENIGSVKDGFEYTHYIQDKNLTDAAKALDEKVKENADAIANVYTRTDADGIFLTKTDAANTYVQKVTDNNKTTTSIGDFVVTETSSGSTVTINENDDDKVVFDTDGITVGEHSARMSGSGFYVWAPNDSSNHNTDYAIASMTDDGKIKGANGNFEVGADGSVKVAGDKFKVDKDGNVSAEKITAKEVEAENLYTKAEIDEKLGGSNASVAGINQRLDKTNAKINKVGAGAAALAALHPLDYDPDDKLTFSAGMGNYAGENAAALGAFYRPNEKFMLSLGGTMGNGENMVNLGISIGLDKANGFAKMSKRELIQEVNAVKAENEAIKADNEAMKAEMAEMKAMLQELLAKK
ncbi:MAG: YadA-like family protein [Phascolarctobacterium sp.]|nr:YadA-like family protein [Phascolarctobacterium sp.]